MLGRGRFRQEGAKRKATDDLISKVNTTSLSEALYSGDVKLSNFSKQTIDSLNRSKQLTEEKSRQDREW